MHHRPRCYDSVIEPEMGQTGDVAAEGKEVVISRASADCKRQSVLRADGYGEMMKVLHNQPQHTATAAAFSNKGLLRRDARKIFIKSFAQHACMHRESHTIHVGCSCFKQHQLFSLSLQVSIKFFVKKELIIIYSIDWEERSEKSITFSQR